MIGMLSTLAPNFSVPCGRPVVAISGGATGAPWASARVETPATLLKGPAARAAAAAALRKNVRRVTPSVSLVMRAVMSRVLDDLDAEDVAAVRTLQALPSGVDAGIAADESDVVPVQPVRIARSGRKITRHQQLAGLPVIFVQAGFPVGVAGAVVAGHHPDIALVVERHVVEARLLLGARADQDLGHPRRWIDTQDAAQTQRGNPKLAVVPLHAMATTAAAVDAERNLTVAELLRVHVHLKDAEWFGVRTHPHAAAPVRHAGGIARMRGDG